MALSRTSRGNDYDLVANALTVGAFTPADGALLVAVHFRFRSGSSTPGSSLSGGGLTWTQRVNHLHASSLDWDPAVAIWTAPVTTGASMTVTATTSTATHRHGLYVLEYGGASGVGATGTAGFSGATGDLSITLSGTPAADSEVVAAILGRNWVGTASAVGIAGNGTELHRKVSANGAEVDELYTVVQAITGMSGTSQVFWEDTDLNNSNGNQGTATVALEITASAEDEPIIGTMAAQESGSDTLAGTGSAAVSGGMVATEAGADAFAGSGGVRVSGVMAATEAIGSGFSAGFSAGFGGAGEAFSASGSVIVSGVLAAVDAGADGFASSGDVVVSGTMAAAETGDDTAAMSSPAEVSGSLAAIEVGADIAAMVGSAFVAGAMAAQEAGFDTFAGTNVVLRRPTRTSGIRPNALSISVRPASDSTQRRPGSLSAARRPTLS